MFDLINKLLSKVFSNEESVIFSLLIFSFLLILYLFGGLLTPFIVSLIFSYLLIGLSKNFTKYGWDKNAGYGTKHHLKAIKKFGITKHHRKTFFVMRKASMVK